jgi:hypothetical protein
MDSRIKMSDEAESMYEQMKAEYGTNPKHMAIIGQAQKENQEFLQRIEKARLERQEETIRKSAHIIHGQTLDLCKETFEKVMELVMRMRGNE